MSDPATLVATYLAAWNETDPVRRRALIAGTWTETANYLDPLMHSTGHAGIDAMLAAVQQRFAGLVFRQRGAVDAHNDRLRFQWELAPPDGEAVAAGTDFATLAACGRLQSVTGFLDLMPQ